MTLISKFLIFFNSIFDTIVIIGNFLAVNLFLLLQNDTSLLVNQSYIFDN